MSKPDNLDFFSKNRTKEEALEIYNQRIADAKIIYEKFHKTFTKRNCPYCLSTEYLPSDKFLDLYEVAHCLSCDSLYVNPCPSPESLQYYYNKCECNLLFDKLLVKRGKKKEKNVVNRGKLTNVTDILKQIKKKKINILEIGCGSGSFLNLLDSTLQNDFNFDEYNLYGVDIDGNAISNNENKNINFTVGSAETFQINKKFDIIIHFELIEHLPNPNKMMSNIYKHLEEDGYSYFTTPNALGFEIKAIHYNNIRFLAHGIFPPMHLNAFNQRNLTHFLLRNNFKVRNISTPGIFDVSIVKNTLLVNGDNNDNMLGKLLNFDDKTLTYIQKIIRYLDASSHMDCLVQK